MKVLEVTCACGRRAANRWHSGRALRVVTYWIQMDDGSGDETLLNTFDANQRNSKIGWYPSSNERIGEEWRGGLLEAVAGLGKLVRSKRARLNVEGGEH